MEPARALGEDTLQRCRRVLGPDHPTTLWPRPRSSLALSGLGEAEPARALGEDTLQRCRRVLGPDHPIKIVGSSPTPCCPTSGEGPLAAGSV